MRRLGWIALVGLAVLGAAAATLFVARVPLATAVVESRLAAMGLDRARFTIRVLEPDRLLVEDIRIGEAVRLKHLAASYSLRGLLARRVDRVAAEGLRIDLTGGDNPLRGLSGDAGAGGGAGWTVGQAVLRDAAARLPTPAGPVSAALAATLRLDGNGAGEGEVALHVKAAQLAVQGARLARVALSLPLDVSFGEAGFAAVLSAPGTLAFASAEAGPVSVQAPVSAMLEPSPSPLLAASRGEDGWFLEAALTAVVSDIPLRFARDGAAETAVLEPGRIALSAEGAAAAPRLGAIVQNAALRLPARKLALRTVSATVDAAPASGRGHIRLTGAELQSTADPAPFAPVALQGEAALAGGRATFQAVAQSGSGKARVEATGSHVLAEGAGQATLRTRGFDFAPGGLQPAALSPLLAFLSNVRGGLGADAALRWSGDGLSGTGEIVLDALSFAVAGISVEGLDGGARFSQLLPPATPPGQSLRIRRVRVGIPIEDVALRFAVPAGGQRLAVESFEARIAGGAVSAAQATFTAAGNAGPIRLRVRNLGIAPLFDSLGLEDVDGTGALAGEIPLWVRQDGIAIAGAKLTALGEGRLSIRSEQVREALRAGGEQASLLIRALEDFRYDALTLAIDKALDGATRVTLHLAGHNPAVLDGRPFRLNINLDTDLDDVLRPLLEGYRLWSETLGDIIAPVR